MPNTSTYYPPGYLDEYIGLRLKAVAIAFLVLDCTFVALRFYARYLHSKYFQWRLDDWLIIVSLIFCLGTQTCAFIAVDEGGVGRHIEYTEQFYTVLRTWYQTCMVASAVLYMLSAAFPKLAILYLYLQIFTDRFSRWSTWATAGALVVNLIVMIPLLVDVCHPISYGWKSLYDPSLEDGWCADVTPRYRYASIANIVTDIAMLLIPIRTLRRLQIDRVTKLGLYATFGMALAGLLTACFRFGAFFKTSAYNDETWSSVDLVTWCIVEPGIYMFVACQMAFHPLFVAISRSVLWGEMTRVLSSCLDKGASLQARLRGKTPEKAGERIAKRTIDGSNLFESSTHETRIEAETQAFPSAPPSVFDDNIWIRHEFNVRNCSDPNDAPACNLARRPSSY